MMGLRWVAGCVIAWTMVVNAIAGSIDVDQIDQRIQSLMKDDPNMVGLAIAIVENGELKFTKGYGETAIGTGDPVTPDTVFRWASVSKGVAAAAVLSLSEDGHFGLNSPVRAHAPSLKLPESKTEVTVEDVLDGEQILGIDDFGRKLLTHFTSQRIDCVFTKFDAATERSIKRAA